MLLETAEGLTLADIIVNIIGCFRTKLYLLCKCGPVQQFVQSVDYLFYQNLVRVLIPDVLRPIPSELHALCNIQPSPLPYHSCLVLTAHLFPDIYILNVIVTTLYYI
jgi:hypothetical protein